MTHMTLGTLCASVMKQHTEYYSLMLGEYVQKSIGLFFTVTTVMCRTLRDARDALRVCDETATL